MPKKVKVENNNASLLQGNAVKVASERQTNKPQDEKQPKEPKQPKQPKQTKDTKQTKGKKPTGFALFVKENYQSVKDLPNGLRLKELAKKYKESKNVENKTDKK